MADNEQKELKGWQRKYAEYENKIKIIQSKLRKHVVVMNNNGYWTCLECGSTWHPIGEEYHKLNCVLKD